MVTTNVRFARSQGTPSAEYLVLGHSLGTSAALWDPALALLGEKFTVIRWELPGHGEAARATARFEIQDLSEDIVDHMSSIGVTQFRYAGVSIGATVGLDLALRHAEVVRSAAVISTGASVDSPDAWRERAALVRTRGIAAISEGTAERWFSAATRKSAPNVVDHLIDVLHATDGDSYAYACEAIADYDVRARLGDVQVPILAMWGDADRLVPEARSVEIAQGVQRGTVRRIVGAAHASPSEQPVDVARSLIEFFASDGDDHGER
ncbi:MAG: alpha/beta fold hydrolase [Actinobacteria bacterium]|nr:alpha/beta fold hydrolase [Actinomycetota bacterium]